jgi:Fe2+ transport system protein B
MDKLKKNFTNELIDIFIEEISKNEVKDKINTHIVDPSMTTLFERLYPYIIITSVIFILIFFMAITIIYLLIIKK